MSLSRLIHRMDISWMMAFSLSASVMFAPSLGAQPAPDPAADAVAQPATQPADNQQPATEPAATEPAAQPAPAQPAAATDPAAPAAASEPTAPQPASTEPAAPGQATSGQATSEPATPEPAAQPSASQPSATQSPANPSPPVAEVPISDDERAAQGLLAERFIESAKTLMMQNQIVPATVQQSGAWLEAAARLKPSDPRVLRLLIESRIQRANSEETRSAAREAIASYLKIVPTDQVQQARLIEFYARDLQSADKKLNYLASIIAADSVPAEVRSAAAVLLARVQEERGGQTEVDDAIDTAIKLNPLNSAALRWRFSRRAGGATSPQRLAMLFDMLRADPAQSELMSRIAHELAASGLNEQAISWYASSFNLSNRMGRGLSMSDFLEQASALIVAGQPRDALPAVEKILAADPGNADAAFIRLLAQKRLSRDAAGADAVTAAETGAQDCLDRRIQDLHAKLTGTDSAPATQPVDAIREFINADAQSLSQSIKQGNNPDQLGGYIGALARLAWFELYFKHDAVSAEKTVVAIRELLPETDVTRTRLEGWLFFVQGKNEEARSKLSAVAERDPLSQLGVIEIAEAESKPAESKLGAAPATQPATNPSPLDDIDPAHPGAADHSKPLDALIKVAGENASGITGAILVDELRQRHARFVPSENSTALFAELNKFPSDFLNFLTKPNEFYKISAAPLAVSHKYGEPMFVKITFQNIGKYDLSIGDDGAIHPDLWFDAKMVGLIQQSVDAAAYDRLTGAIVLKAKTGIISQIVRVDEGRLGQLFPQQPILSLPLQFSVFTNPVTSVAVVGTTTNTTVIPGPGGFRVQFDRVVERGPTPLASPAAVQNILAMLGKGTPIERMRIAEFAASLSSAFDVDPNASPDMKRVGQEFFNSIERVATMHDESPSAHAWLMKCWAASAPDARRPEIVAEMLRSDDWRERLLGLRVMQSYPGDQQKAVAVKFGEKDPDPLVRTFADSMMKTADMQPVNPTTQPAGMQPAAPAAAPTAAPPSDPSPGN